ncbi:MAG: flavodoxin family protein [Pseudomonadota bacterium]|nr:flavodoxin family protein [Pseudomonadota bacterium]
MTRIRVRKGMPDVQLTRKEFSQRYTDRFFDPLFDASKAELAVIIDGAWTAYDEYHKNPRKKRAGRAFSKPDAELPVEWLDTRRRIEAARRERQSPKSKSRILIVNGSSRSDQSCPGEMSKTWRLAMLAKDIVDKEKGFEVEVLDLSRLTSEYGRIIYPCKACLSTAQPLCHWPCSCYPNYAMGQVNDWMNSIYPMWMRAHGVMIVTPVNWYQAPSSLKLMIDRLVCADGGNPDPTTTDGKDPRKAKELELEGWPYPRHLAGRLFSIVVHGDASGVENLRRMLTDWLTDIGLFPAGHKATIGSYVGYYEPYATSHDDLDKDKDFQQEVRNAARTLVNAVRLQRQGKLAQPDAGLEEPRPK